MDTYSPGWNREFERPELARGIQDLSGAEMDFERAATGPGAMIDPFGRAISYLRVSGDRPLAISAASTACRRTWPSCPSRPADARRARPAVLGFVAKGVRKLRSPAASRWCGAHHDAVPRALPPARRRTLEELTLYHNGSQLPKYAAELAACGIKRNQRLASTRSRRQSSARDHALGRGRTSVLPGSMPPRRRASR